MKQPLLPTFAQANDYTHMCSKYCMRAMLYMNMYSWYSDKIIFCRAGKIIERSEKRFRSESAASEHVGFNCLQV